MRQYCRYCVFCFESNDFWCSNHPKGEKKHWSREQINRENHCPNFTLSDLGDVETGKPYRERGSYKHKHITDSRQISLLDEVSEHD